MGKIYSPSFRPSDVNDFICEAECESDRILRRISFFFAICARHNVICQGVRGTVERLSMRELVFLPMKCQ